MKKILYCLALLLLGLGAVSFQKKEMLETKPPKVIVSIAPHQYFVQRIAGDTVDVVCLVPKGTDPHLYETPARLIEEVLSAAVWFRLEEPGEKKFVELFSSRAKAMKLVSMSEGLDLIEEPNSCCHHHHHHEAKDLHIWLSPRLAIQQAKTICKELSALFPQNAVLYNEHLAKVCHDLEALDQEIAALFVSCPTTAILLSHPSLGYFCRDYNIEQLSIEVEGKEPLPHALTHLLDEAKSKNIRKILLQPQHPSKGAQRIADELGVPLETIDPYADDYLSFMRQIAYAIAS